MALTITLLLIFTLLSSWAITGIVRRYALARSILDYPNERSSHTRPIARGGGLGFVLVFLLGLLILCALGRLPVKIGVGLGVGGLALAAMGWLDDRRSLPPSIRFACQLLICIWTLLYLGGFPPVVVMGQVVASGWVGFIFLLISMVWLINVFNFMDGIDGIAGSMAVFAACAGGALAWAGGNMPTTMIGFMLAGSVSGFLIWNWPPARIFMGDVGSGFLGFVLGTLVILNMQHNSSNTWVWVILLGLFLADATTTLIRRIALGKRWWQAHHSHAYQHLARRWGSHRRVVLLALCTDIFWLLPLAILAWRKPFFAMPLALAANVPLLYGCLKAEAGLGE